MTTNMQNIPHLIRKTINNKPPAFVCDVCQRTRYRLGRKATVRCAEGRVEVLLCCDTCLRSTILVQGVIAA